MRTTKDFYVVAYDVSSDKRRRAVAKLLEKYGHRENASVFECMVTPAEAIKMKAELAMICNKQKDRILIYPLCLNCFAKADYLQRRQDMPKHAAVYR